MILHNPMLHNEEFFAKDTIRLTIPNLNELTFMDEIKSAIPVMAASETKNIGGLDW